MIAAFDVHYPPEGGASVAAVLFSGYRDAQPAAAYTAWFETAADYEPGRFYRRELPLILALLGRMHPPPDEIVVDGYVVLGKDRPGLGQHLFDRLCRKIPVIGVAKSKFKGACPVEVFRGKARRPLYVTAAGTDLRRAAENIRSMHGNFRIPALLQAADRLARQNEGRAAAADPWVRSPGSCRAFSRTPIVPGGAKVIRIHDPEGARTGLWVPDSHKK